MVGYYNKSAPETPKLVQWTDRLVEHRNAGLAIAAGLLLILTVFAFFVPRLGLILLVIAAVGMLAGYVVLRSRSQYRTHWTRETHRR